MNYKTAFKIVTLLLASAVLAVSCGTTGNAITPDTDELTPSSLIHDVVPDYGPRDEAETGEELPFAEESALPFITTEETPEIPLSLPVDKPEFIPVRIEPSVGERADEAETPDGVMIAVTSDSSAGHYDMLAEYEKSVKQTIPATVDVPVTGNEPVTVMNPAFVEPEQEETLSFPGITDENPTADEEIETQETSPRVPEPPMFGFRPTTLAELFAMEESSWTAQAETYTGTVQPVSVTPDVKDSLSVVPEFAEETFLPDGSETDAPDIGQIISVSEFSEEGNAGISGDSIHPDEPEPAVSQTVPQEEAGIETVSSLSVTETQNVAEMLRNPRILMSTAFVVLMLILIIFLKIRNRKNNH